MYYACSPSSALFFLLFYFSILYICVYIIIYVLFDQRGGRKTKKKKNATQQTMCPPQPFFCIYILYPKGKFSQSTLCSYPIARPTITPALYDTTYMYYLYNSVAHVYLYIIINSRPNLTRAQCQPNVKYPAGQLSSVCRNHVK